MGQVSRDTSGWLLPSIEIVIRVVDETAQSLFGRQDIQEIQLQADGPEIFMKAIAPVSVSNQNEWWRPRLRFAFPNLGEKRPRPLLHHLPLTRFDVLGAIGEDNQAIIPEQVPYIAASLETVGGESSLYHEGFVSIYQKRNSGFIILKKYQLFNTLILDNVFNWLHSKCKDPKPMYT